jgi:flavin reductase (DIM6/NTAB) family NADH-FMN oxidoreductase RutF
MLEKVHMNPEIKKQTLPWFEARVTDVVKRGDHTVFIAEVVNAGLRDPEAKPLEMWDTGWFYGG